MSTTAGREQQQPTPGFGANDGWPKIGDPADAGHDRTGARLSRGGCGRGSRSVTTLLHPTHHTPVQHPRLWLRAVALESTLGDLRKQVEELDQDQCVCCCCLLFACGLRLLLPAAACHNSCCAVRGVAAVVHRSTPRLNRGLPPGSSVPSTRRWKFEAPRYTYR